MLLTLVQTAALLGKSPKQIRYLVKNGTIVGQKAEGRWMFDDTLLPLTADQKQQQVQRTVELREVVDQVLTQVAPAAVSRVYSVQDLNVFRALVNEIRTCRELAPDSMAFLALRRGVICLTQGCHRYADREKADAYWDARDHIAEAVALLYCETDPELHAVARRLESELMSPLSGLVRRYDHRKAK